MLMECRESTSQGMVIIRVFFDVLAGMGGNFAHVGINFAGGSQWWLLKSLNRSLYVGSCFVGFAHRFHRCLHVPGFHPDVFAQSGAVWGSVCSFLLD